MEDFCIYFITPLGPIGANMHYRFLLNFWLLGHPKFFWLKVLYLQEKVAQKPTLISDSFTSEV